MSNFRVTKTESSKGDTLQFYILNVEISDKSKEEVIKKIEEYFKRFS
jgi:hypothetical protein